MAHSKYEEKYYYFTTLKSKSVLQGAVVIFLLSKKLFINNQSLIRWIEWIIYLETDLALINTSVFYCDRPFSQQNCVPITLDIYA